MKRFFVVCFLFGFLVGAEYAAADDNDEPEGLSGIGDWVKKAAQNMKQGFNYDGLDNQGIANFHNREKSEAQGILETFVNQGAGPRGTDIREHLLDRGMHGEGA